MRQEWYRTWRADARRRAPAEAARIVLLDRVLGFVSIGVLIVLVLGMTGLVS